MAKCKDCLHYCACVMMYEKTWGEPPKIGGGDGQCDTFADRSRYVVREKGEWELYPSSEYRRCNVCKKEYEKARFNERANFCPNCGADMRKGEKG